MSCRHHIYIILSFSLQIGILSCIKNKSIAEPELLKQENFETEIENKKVQLYTLRNTKGTVWQFTNFGARCYPCGLLTDRVN